jgi:phosphatidylglycerophosphatase A
VATGAFLGYCPGAPGTAGSLLGAAIGLLAPRPSPGVSVTLVAAAFLLAVAVAGAAARALGEPDPQVVVIDEVWAMWAASLTAPPGLGALAALFLLFRAFDIWKPFPAWAAQRLPGGWGIVADDAAAAGCAVAAYHAVAALGRAAGLSG